MTQQSLSIIDLPDHVLSAIASLLQLEDLRSYRLTCTDINKFTYTKDAMKHANVRIIFDGQNKQYYGYGWRRVIVPKDFKCLLKFLEKLQYGMNASVSISPVKSDGTQDAFEDLLANYIKDASNLTISLKHIETISRCSPGVEKLKLHLDLVLPHSFGNSFQICDESALPRFNRLTQLSIHGLSLPIAVLGDIVSCIPLLNTLIFYTVSFCSCTSYFSDNVAFKTISVATLQEKVSKAQHITNWTLNRFKVEINVEAGNSEEYVLFELPASTTHLTCIGSKINFHYNNLERLVYIQPYDHEPKWNVDEYKKLIHLDLEDLDFTDGTFPICSSVQYLKLSETTETINYLEKLSLYPADELKYLILEYTYDFSSDSALKLAKIITGFKSLVYLQIAEKSFDEIQPLVDEIMKLKSSTLKHIVLFNYTEEKKSIVC